MLSVCIPIYNYDVRQLVEQLSEQAAASIYPIEIVLIDDASSAEYKEINKAICQQHHYIELPNNIGRAQIRNLFILHTTYDYLLFLDCDALLVDKDFLSRYINLILNERQIVVCGGRIYPGKRPNRPYLLRWKYGVKKESKTALERMKTPNQSFMTNNFLIHKSVFNQVAFNEKISQYGHEDTLFGFQLTKIGIEIRHIENPILNGDQEENAVYLAKTLLGLENLKTILSMVEDKDAFIKSVTILKFSNGIDKRNLGWIVKAVFWVLEPIIRLLLINGIVWLPAFDFYKLGIFLKLKSVNS